MASHLFVNRSSPVTDSDIPAISSTPDSAFSRMSEFLFHQDHSCSSIVSDSESINTLASNRELYRHDSIQHFLTCPSLPPPFPNTEIAGVAVFYSWRSGTALFGLGPSHLPNAGIGIFALTDSPAGTHVSEYGGLPLRGPDVCHGAVKSHFFALHRGGGMILDGRPRLGHYDWAYFIRRLQFASFCNSISPDSEDDHITENAKLDVIPRPSYNS